MSVEGSSTFRDYRHTTRDSVESFYRLNHERQTWDFAVSKRAQYGRLDHAVMGIWEACEKLDTLVDDSDPDLDLGQLTHLLQTAEAIRSDGHPDWFILTGLLHDLGKLLCLWGEPQWAVVGDTFPLGCPFSDRIVYSEFFEHNPDRDREEFQQPLGIYQEGIGLDHVVLSWGHDEYLYQVCRPYLPEEALAIIRYHSFYAAHQEGEYEALMNERDKERMHWVRRFQPYDLYSKSPVAPDPAALKPYYELLIRQYFPDRIRF